MAGSMKTSPARPKPEAWAAHGHCHRVRLGHRTSHPPGPGGGRRGGDISRSRRRSSSDCPPGPVSGTAGPGAAAGCQRGRKRGRSIPDCRPYPRNAAPTGQQCAGTGSSGSLLAETSTKALDTVIRTDLYGPFFCCREFLKPPAGMARPSTSLPSTKPFRAPGTRAPPRAACSPSHAVWRWRLPELRIIVNAIAPGLIRTPMTTAPTGDPETRAEEMPHIPRHRPGEPWEVARVAFYLASDDSKTSPAASPLTADWN